MLKEAWSIAIETLSWMETQRLSERMALTKTVKQLGIENPDASRYAYGLIAETVRRKNLIDRFINAVITPKELDELTIGVQAFLQLYVYQTRIRRNWTQIDIKEAELIAKLGRSILGWKTLREIEPVLGFLLTRQIEPILKTATEEERIGLQTFHPTWFVHYCINLFGRNEAVTFLEGDLNSPPTSIRLNTLRGSQQEILQRLTAEGVELERIEPLKFAYKVTTTRKPLTNTTSFKEGQVYIQDKASCFAAEATNPKPTSTVLDVCAAPGAKTTYLAQLMQNQGMVYSIDYSTRRMRVWKKEVSRMGVRIAEPIIMEASHLSSLAVDADVVVLDPPCTSTGAFGKFPSAKWRITPKSIARMAEIQKQMINACAEKVKPRGVLTYSTCSITIEENELIIERFLKDHPEFFLAKISPELGLPGLRGLDNCRRLYPHIHESNGFFVAKLQKQ